MTFYSGQKVVGVCDDPFNLVREGRIYTVLRPTMGVWPDGTPMPCALLVEMEAPMPHTFFGWHVRWFRPAVDKKTDISVFERLLDTTKDTIGVTDEVR